MISRAWWFVAALSCTPRAESIAVSAAAVFPAPVEEGDAVCTDVGVIRACWSGAGQPRLVPRPVPARPAASALGWRCLGRGAARVCVDRLRDAAPFACLGERCVQRHPRRPDDGEWTCSEMAGATICAGGDTAASVPHARADDGWFCDQRRLQRICVDFSPDFPDGVPGRWRCRHEGTPGPARVCERGEIHALGDPCDAGHPCVDGSRCAGGRCLPLPPDASCFTDADCPGGGCRFGACRRGAR